MAQGHDATDGEPRDNHMGVGITTAMDSYRFVDGVEWDGKSVRVNFERGTSFYDRDSAIGNLVRKYGLRFTNEQGNENTAGGPIAHFRRD